MTKYQHCDAEVLSTSQPNRMGTTGEMQKMYDDFDGIGWREYMRGIENGNIDPTGERLRAICKLAREALAATPAVGGEALAWMANYDGNIDVTIYPDTAHLWQEKFKRRITPLYAAQPASPLRGREAIARIIDPVAWANFDHVKKHGATPASENSITKPSLEIADKILSASPPEQPAAQPVTEMHEATRAIIFAVELDDHFDRLEFLKGWIHGDTSEWSDFS